MVTALVNTEPSLVGTKAEVKGFLQQVLPMLHLEVVVEKSRRVPVVAPEPFDLNDG